MVGEALTDLKGLNCQVKCISKVQKQNQRGGNEKRTDQTKGLCWDYLKVRHHGMGWDGVSKGIAAFTNKCLLETVAISLAVK